jgi:SAM-dependent methyltransferase
MGFLEHNRAAWNRQSREGGPWTTPVSSRVIEEARQGRWAVLLTPTRSVPRDWLGEVRGMRILCLASGGGQQAPVLAAAGASVVSFDLSDEQLARDREVAEREGLDLDCMRGNMSDLRVLQDAGFDLVFNPVSSVFIPDLRPLWRESYRVLKPGGTLLTGFMNPSFFLFDHDEAADTGTLVARHRLPYAETDPELLPPSRRRAIHSGEAMEFSHSLEAQIGGQLEAGFIIVGFYEDWWADDATPLNGLSPTSMATRAVRPESPPP